VSAGRLFETFDPGGRRVGELRAGVGAGAAGDAPVLVARRRLDPMLDAAALPQIIDAIGARGYTFVTMSALTGG
jgi:hypothetical protein